MTIARLAVVAALVASTSPARAQSAEADVLFREGKALLKQGKIAEACEKLDASDRLESSVGTLLNLADCRERNHQLATAWATFRKAAVAAKTARDGKRQAEARRRESLLSTRLSYFTVVVPAASKVDGLTVTRNGVEVDHELWNQPVPIDEGAYELAASADGFVGWSQRFAIEGEGKKAQLEVPALAPKPKPKAEREPAHASIAVKQPPPREDEASDEPPRKPPPHKTLTATRDVAIVFAVLGAGGVGLGVAAGLHGKHLEQESDALCPTSTCNDASALKANSDARTYAKYANIGFAAGGGAIAVAVVLWIVGAPGHVTPVVERDRVGLAFSGQF
jgi:hypothetical protein